MSGKIKNKFTLVCFANGQWNNLWKRNQSMVAQLANADFVKDVVFITPGAWPEDNPLITLKSLLDNAAFENVSNNIYQFKPYHFIPFKSIFSVSGKIENLLYYKLISNFISGSDIILLVNTTDYYFCELIELMINRATFSLYDFSDDFLEFDYPGNGKKRLSEFITRIIPQVDAVISVNDHIKNKYTYLNNNSFVIRNATNFSNFNKPCYDTIDLLESIKTNNQPIIGYSGTANDLRIDVELLNYLFEKRQSWNFVFIGNSEDNLKSRFSSRNNVHFLPAVPYTQLPDYINYFDVCISPMLVNNHTRGNDLLKLHDYLAMGKPIVSTNIGGADDYKDIISVVHDHREFLFAIESELHGSSGIPVDVKLKLAHNNSWEYRINELVDLIKHCPAYI